ncbi:MAG: amidohydrolase family protein [Planctomycetota bacterium]
MIKRIFVISFSLFLYTFTYTSGAANLAIQGGNIQTISNGAIEHGTILIRDGKIEALGSDVVIPSDTRIIEAKNKFIMPGLIDAQSQLYVIESELNERRTIAPELNILDALDPFMKGHQEVLAQGVTAVYVSSGSISLLGGRGAVLKLNGSKTVNKMVLKADVAIKGVIGASSNNQSSSLTRLEHYSSIREALIATQAYMQTKRKYEQELSEYKKRKSGGDEEKKDNEQEKAKKEKPKRPTKPKLNPTYEILSKVLRKEIPIQIEAHRVDDILNALRLKDEFDLNLILDKCTEGYMIANEIARRKIPVIVGPISTSFVNMPKLEYRNHDMMNAAILSEKGIKLALGVSGRDGVSSKYVALAAALAVANDLNKDIALRAITLTPAEILGVADRIGSLEPGKDADIIILSGHPLDTFTQVEMVLIEGKTVYERKATQ